MPSSPAASIQTRTLLWSSPRQVPMPHDLRFRKENLQIPEKVNESRFLLSGHGIARLAFLIQTSLIADADRTSIIRSGMRTHLQQLTMLRHRSILSDVEVVADVIKPTCLMVTSQLFNTIVLIASGSRAMQNQIFNVVTRHILTLSHNSTFNTQHYSIAFAQELTPSAVRAAIRAWTTAFKIETQEIFLEPSLKFFIIRNVFKSET